MTANDWGEEDPRNELEPVDTDDVEIVSIEAVDEIGVPLEMPAPPPQEAPAEAEEPASEALTAAREEVRALRDEHEQLMERHLRLLAEFDNYRRRRDREAAEEHGEGMRDVMRSALPVLDSLERALESLPPATPPSVATGIDLVHRQLRDSLRGLGLEEVDALGETFDPRRHEAISLVPRDDFEDQQVIEQMQKGYEHGGRLLRPALVKVVSNPDGTVSRDPASEGGADRGEDPTPPDEEPRWDA